LPASTLGYTGPGRLYLLPEADICDWVGRVSLVAEEHVFASLAQTLGTAAGEEEAPAQGVSLIRFMADVRTVVNALLLGAGLEGARFRRLVEDYSRGEAGLPAARALVVLEGFAFYLYAKPYIDVEDIDLLVDEAGEAAERHGVEEVVPVAAGYELSYDAERYAKSIDVEIIRLGL
jgi:hypothetical protein